LLVKIAFKTRRYQNTLQFKEVAALISVRAHYIKHIGFAG